jgi:hypothetical protein
MAESLQSEVVAQSSSNIRCLAAFWMVEFWLLFFAMACIIGSNVATMNITSTIVKDRGIGSSVVADLVQVMTNSTSALFRCLVGLVLYFAPRLPKGAPLVFSGFASVVAQLLYATGVDYLAFVAAISVGISDGVIWTSLPWLTGLIFGLENNGSIFGCLVLLASIGVLLMGDIVEPAVYSSHVVSGESECNGAKCFFLFHVIAAAVCFFGTIATIILHQCVSSNDRARTCEDEAPHQYLEEE